jgi:hypothetical protein
MSMNKVAGNAVPAHEAAGDRAVAVGSQNLTLTRHELIAGAWAGVGAGITMGLTAIIVSLANGFGLWTPFNDVAGALFPSILSQAGPGTVNLQTVIAGILIHFSIAVLLGILFTTIYSGLLKLTFDFGVPITMGLAYSWIIWMVVRFFFLPWLQSPVYEMPAFIIAHGIFGVTLGLLYPIIRRRLRAG